MRIIAIYIIHYNTHSVINTYMIIYIYVQWVSLCVDLYFLKICVYMYMYVYTLYT